MTSCLRMRYSCTRYSVKYTRGGQSPVSMKSFQYQHRCQYQCFNLFAVPRYCWLSKTPVQVLESSEYWRTSLLVPYCTFEFEYTYWNLESRASTCTYFTNTRVLSHSLHCTVVYIYCDARRKSAEFSTWYIQCMAYNVVLVPCTRNTHHHSL